MKNQLLYVRVILLFIATIVYISCSEKEEPYNQQQELNPFENSVKASSFGYNPTDATDALQMALSSDNDTIVIDKQGSDWNVKPSKLFDVSDKVIFFEKGVKIKAIPNEFNATNAKIFFLVRPRNLKFIGYGAELIMNKHELENIEHSEARHAIHIAMGDNITIEGLSIKDATGDGIYIGGSGINNENSYSKNIQLKDLTITNSFRQGMSIISVENLTVTNCVFENTKGTLPEAGIDIEPNKNFERIVNVNFEDCKFINNNHAGILIAVVNLDDTSKPISVNFKNCYLKNNHVESNPYSKAEIVLGASKKFNTPVKGNILLENIHIERSDWRALYSRKTSNSYTVTLKDCFFENLSQHATYEHNSPFFFEVSSYTEASPDLGGYNFDNVTLKYNSDHKFMTFYGSKTLSGVSNITGNIKVVHPNSNNEINYVNVENITNVTLDYSINN